MNQRERERLIRRRDDERRAWQLVGRVIDAGPVGRTLVSIRTEFGWSPREAQRALDQAWLLRLGDDEPVVDRLTFAPESATFYWLPPASS